MKKLFLIDGAAGTGKSDLLEYIKDRRSADSVSLTKFSTRSERSKEEAVKNDLLFIDEEEFNEYKKDRHSEDNKFYLYSYGGAEYGFYRKDIDTAFNKYKNVFLIIRNTTLIKTLRADFSGKALVIPIFVYTDRNLVTDRLSAEGFSEEQIEFRILRSEASWKDYLSEHDATITTIINNSVKTDFHKRINTLISYYDEMESDNEVIHISPNICYDLIKPLQGYKKKMQKKLKDFPYEKNVFLMMKFRETNKIIYGLIKTLLEFHGYNCVRADEAKWNITNNIYNPLAVLYCCKYGIALFDEPEEHAHYSPNVAYELGIMHSQGKNCLVMRHEELLSTPFDLISNLLVSYRTEGEVNKILADWIQSL